jgi:DNA polymerase-2
MQKSKPSKDTDTPIESVDAWLLDAIVTGKGFRFWLKMRSGKVFAADYTFHPSFYAVIPNRAKILKTGYNGLSTRDAIYTYFIEHLPQHADIAAVELCDRRVQAEDIKPSPVLRIQVKSPLRFKAVIHDIRAMEIFELYNTDIPLVQMFFYESQLFPFAFCEFKIKQAEKQIEIIHFSLKDSNETVIYDLPPLRVVWLELSTAGQRLKIAKSDTLLEARITIDACSVPIALETLCPHHDITIDSHNASQVIIREENERETVLALDTAIRRIDPDVIFTSYGDEELFPYLLARVSYLHLERQFSLSRDGRPLAGTRFQVEGATAFMSYGQIYHRAATQFYLNGRLHIDSAIYGGLHFDDGNLFGIVEVARVAYTPLQRLTRVTIGGALQSLQFFHATHLGILIPEEKKNAEDFRSSADLLKSDRGGHILQPKIGIFQQAGELDYTSMYPALMCRYNVSPETLNCPCCKQDGTRVPGLPYHICRQRQGIVPLSLQVPLAKRIKYKYLGKQKDHPDAKKYQKMEEALKWILVVCFGYLGFRNARFGRIEAHQTVCAYAREFLLTATSVIENAGFQATHGIVDSLWVQSLIPCSDEDFDQTCVRLAKEIEVKTEIPITYTPRSDHFRFICFLPTKQDPSVGALNRYWGKKADGNVKVRGIELRRHDAPPIIKQFQMDLIEAMAQAPQFSDIRLILRNQLFPVLYRYYQLLEQRQIPAEQLAITIRLTREPHHYKVQNYQAIAAAFLERVGVPIHPGMSVSFIIRNDRAQNALERVMPLQLYDPHHHQYDIAKYKELLVRAMTNLLPIPFSEEEKKRLVIHSTMDQAHKFRSQTLLPSFFGKCIK